MSQSKKIDGFSRKTKGRRLAETPNSSKSGNISSNFLWKSPEISRESRLGLARAGPGSAWAGPGLAGAGPRPAQAGPGQAEASPGPAWRPLAASGGLPCVATTQCLGVRSGAWGRGPGGSRKVWGPWAPASSTLRGPWAPGFDVLGLNSIGPSALGLLPETSSLEATPRNLEGPTPKPRSPAPTHPTASKPRLEAAQGAWRPGLGCEVLKRLGQKRG